MMLITIFQTSCQFMRHAKRRKLTAEDFNRALRQSDCQVSEYMPNSHDLRKQCDFMNSSGTGCKINWDRICPV